MTDQEILYVVKAHMHGQTIECKCKGFINSKWGSWGSETWDFKNYDYRVQPKPQELWLQPCGKGLWQEKFVGVGTHFREVIE